jgi:hypothetical protein
VSSTCGKRLFLLTLQALTRDGLRCAVSRVRDLKYGTELTGPIGLTQCAHIIPEALNFDLDKQTKVRRIFLIKLNLISALYQPGHVANVWTVLNYFGIRNVHIDLLGKDIHRLENVMTLDYIIHVCFDSLSFWLEPTVSTNSSTVERSAIETPSSQDTPNRYRTCYVQPFDPKDLHYNIPEFIELTTTDAARLPLPNPAYLALHASCCRVAHLSGAAEFLEWMDEHEDTFSSSVPSGDLSAALTARLLFLEPQSSSCDSSNC